MIRHGRAELSEFAKVASLNRRAWESYANAEAIPDGEHAWRLWVEHALVYAAKGSGEAIGSILWGLTDRRFVKGYYQPDEALSLPDTRRPPRPSESCQGIVSGCSRMRAVAATAD